MEEHDVIIIGAGLTGIYQLLPGCGKPASTRIVLEAADGLGGTWYHNRYPGCRFDSESYTYGYSFSEELLDEWHWTEHFSSQPENLTLPEPRRRPLRPAAAHALRLPGGAGDL